MKRVTSTPGFVFFRSGSAGIDPELPFRPVLWGRSMGAAIAMRTAAAEPSLAALVLESPMVDLDVSMALVLKRRRIPFPKLMARLVTRRAGKLAGVPIHKPRPIDSAPKVTCPTLILHGTNDTVVSIDEARRLATAFPAPPTGSKFPTRATPTSSIKAERSCSIGSRSFSMKRQSERDGRANASVKLTTIAFV